MDFFRRVARLFAVLSLFVAFGRIFAQTGPFEPQKDNPPPLTQLSLEQLGNLEVTTASKEPEQIWRTPAAIFVITQEDIRRSGATSIPEALRLAPGVEVGRVSSNTWAVGIRGLESNFSKSVLVLIDGRSVFTPLFAGVFWDQQDVVMEDIDRIEVIRGPGGTIWGPNAVNGVINIITKNAKDTQGALVSVLGGNVDHFIGATRYGGEISKGLHYRIYAKGFQRDAEFHSNGDAFDVWQQERGGFRVDWGRNDRDDITFQGDLYQGDSTRKVGTGTLSPPTLGVQVTADDSLAGGNLLARWRRKVSDGSDIYVQAYFDRTVRTGPQFDDARNTFDIDFLHRLALGERNTLSYGAGLRFSPYHFGQVSQQVSITPSVDTDYDHSGFIQDEIKLTPKLLTLTAGLKLEYNNFSGFDAQPSARLLITPREHQAFWAAITRAVTTPSLLEEGFNLTGVASLNPLIFLRVSGNPNFQSESLFGFEGGYRQLFSKKVMVDLAVFHNNYYDLQSFGAPSVFAEAAPPPAHTVIDIPYANQIGGATDGFELSTTWTPVPYWRISGSYSFVTTGLHAADGASDISSTGSISTYEGSTPRHQVDIRSYFSLPHGFELDESYRYYSAIPGQNLPAYQTGGARFGWNYRDMQFSVVGENLLQPHHFEWGTGDPNQTPIAMRRSVYGRIVWNPRR